MNSQEIMKECMASNTYEGCKIEKCRACEARKDCDKKTWISLGGIE